MSCSECSPTTLYVVMILFISWRRAALKLRSWAARIVTLLAVATASIRWERSTSHLALRVISSEVRAWDVRGQTDVLTGSVFTK